MDVEVAIWFMRPSYHLCQPLGSTINGSIGVRLSLQKVACAFDPFTNVRIPEEMVCDKPELSS